MRFAAVVRQQQTTARASVGQPVRRPPAGQACVRAQQPAPVKQQPSELPADLDQRVRLVGEW